MKYALVTTTIHIPYAIADYLRNAERHGIKDLAVIVIGDRKSPPETSSYLASLGSRYPIEYLDIAQQQDYLRSAPAFRDFLPFDSVQRRNIGYLFAAWEYGADIIITVDDDNFLPDTVDFFGAHAAVGSDITAPVVTSANGWFNSCWLLNSSPQRSYYHRGYPVSKRTLEHGVIKQNALKNRVMVNVGLWQGDPDVDTISRLDGKSVITGMMEDQSFLVAKNCMCPFNSQNTAFAAELLPCMYLPAIPASFKTPALKGNNNFRYDDIWMSFFTKRCLDTVGGGLLVGHPVVDQKRNAHDLFLDLEKEMIPMRLTDALADGFAALTPKGASILDCYGDCIDQFDRLCRTSPTLKEDERALVGHIIGGMRLWTETVGKH